MEKIQHNWTLEELQILYHRPFFELVGQAHTVHRQHHDVQEVQVCALISIKTGGCPEDCKYCAQSSRYQTPVSAQPLMEVEEVVQMARQAIDRGASRVCLGAAWREVRDSNQFDQVLRMVEAVAALGVEVCCTLGMLKDHQARRLQEAGLYAYNHNLDSSEQFYKTIITTRTYQDRLQTLNVVEKTGLSVCCGAILGMGETITDRLQFLHALSQRDRHPESIPINQLTAVPGTPFEQQPIVPIWEMVRMVATTRIIFPKAMVRLSCGRVNMSHEQHALCFLAGANSLFSGERLLTVANSSVDQDEEMFQLFNLTARVAHSC